jgi:hypothetical protein
MVKIGKHLEVTINEGSVNREKISVIHRSENGQGWGIPLTGVTGDDLRKLADIVDGSVSKEVNECKIVEMIESSGNIQYFVRGFNTKSKEHLDYYVHETKHGITKEEAQKRAWFSAGFLARFFGIKNEDIKLVNFKEIGDEDRIRKYRSINRT